MRNIISFMHISLDGFVAGPKGEMDWITVNDEIFDYGAQRITKGDSALYGKTTFQMMEGYWHTAAEKPNATKHDIEHSEWYKKINKIVISNSLNENDFKKTKVIKNNLLEEINLIKNQEGNEILVFGSPRATHSLIEKDLIDGYWLFVNPIILGNGIPLFKNIQGKTKLNLISTKQFSCGVTELNYSVT